MAHKKNINSELYYQRAFELGLDAKRLPHIDGFVVKLGGKNHYFRGGFTPFNNSSSVSVAENKYCMNKVLRAAGIPMPNAIGITREEYQQGHYSLSDLKFPLAAKPTCNTQHGEDVLCNIQNEQRLHNYLKDKFAKHSTLSIEEFHGGLKSYRILVFYNKVIGITQRIPAHVVGDGINSIAQLIELTNMTREKIGEKMSLTPITVDEEYWIRLNEIGMTLDSIPQKDEVVQLCYACNSWRGGTAITPSEKICKENAELAIRAAKALNLDFVGFDVVCENISIPMTQSSGVFIEANHHPDISNHEVPMAGTPQPVSKKIMQRLIYQHPFSYGISCFKKALGA